MKICNKCNTLVKDDELLCPNCGYNMLNDYISINNKNRCAIIGFILSFLFPPMGLILSIIGLCKVKKYQHGKGFAIAGIVISIIMIVLIILMLIFLYELLYIILISFFEGMESGEEIESLLI